MANTEAKRETGIRVFCFSSYQMDDDIHGLKNDSKVA